MDLTPDPTEEKPLPANIVFINPEAEAEELEIRKAKHANQYPCCGTHKKVLVDHITRTVTCRACGFTIDPFDYLLQWAKEGDQRMKAMKSAEIQRSIFSRECEDLKRQCDNLRARLKRCGFPQPEVERLKYRSERDNTGVWNEG
jgi:hypothetical protein